MENYNLLKNVDNVFVNCVGENQAEFSKKIKNLKVKLIKNQLEKQVKKLVENLVKKNQVKKLVEKNARGKR